MFTEMKNSMPILMNDPEMKAVLKTTNFLKSKRQPPNLKKLLTKLILLVSHLVVKIIE